MTAGQSPIRIINEISGSAMRGEAEGAARAERRALSEASEAVESKGPWRLLPGLLLAVAIAVTATLLRKLPGLSIFSAMILAAIIGIGIRNLFGRSEFVRPGITFSMRLPLRTAIVLLGLQLTLLQLASIGGKAFAVVIFSLVGTFAFMIMMARILKVEAGLSYLLATGTSICGAAAIVAANSVVRAKDGDVFYALGCITLFGTITMFVYPPIAATIGLPPEVFGVWTGASIHEVAQVVGASFQHGQVAGEAGTIAKLTRVLMLAPVVLLLPYIFERRSDVGAKVPTPWFVFGFVAMVTLNSIVPVPAEMTAAASQITAFLLALALAAMGLETDLRALNARGIRPLLLGALGTVFISVFSLMLIKLLMLR